MKHIRSLLVMVLLPLMGTALLAQENGKMADMKNKMKAKMAAKGDSKADGKADDMMADHREMTQLVEKLAQSLTALEGEHDHAALMAKLAEHRKLIERMQALVAKHAETPDKPAEAAPAAAHQH